MSASKVYFTDLRTSFNENLPQKLERLIKTAGIGQIDFTNKFTAIKIHFGEPGNLAFLRPNYAAVVAKVVKELGGKPFLTDCNTLYVGGRKNALDHIDAAYANGFSPFSTGCHVIIADGLKGTDEALVPVEGGTYVKEAKIGRAIMDADVFISLAHFKGHECTGFGGALKNIGMGCGSRAGKMEMHSAGKPFVNQDACIGVCPMDAVCAAQDESNDILNCKIAEYSKAVVSGRPQFHINMVIDVSPYCDCHAENDVPIVPDIGMFASFDPVALDQACVDAVNRQPIMPGSHLDEVAHDHHDHFTDSSPATNWKSCLEHAEKIGLGTREYELIKI